MRMIKKIKQQKAIGSLASSIILTVILSTLISGISLWYISLHKSIQDNGVQPTGMAIAQDRINDVLNKNFYDNYKKAQANTVVDNIKDADGNIIYPGDKYSVSTKYSNATTCNGELCYFVSVDVKDKKTGDKIFSSSETIYESTSGRGIPIGTILPFSGDLSKIPYGWEPYDKMDGKYSKGTMSESNLYETGGREDFVLKSEHIPAYSFNFHIPQLLGNGVTKYALYQVNGRHIKVFDPHTEMSVVYGATEGDDFISMDGYPAIWSYERYIEMADLDFYVQPDKWKGMPFDMNPSYYKVGYIIKTKEIN